MTKYRLKKEAVQFFAPDLATRVYTDHIWETLYKVHINALEEVEKCYITYGHDKEFGTDLSGWKSDGDKSCFHFTIHFPNIPNKTHGIITAGPVVREMMDQINEVMGNFREYLESKYTDAAKTE